VSLIIYNIALIFYYSIICSISIFNKKAKLWLNGRRATQQLLENHELAAYKGAIICHAASLGEFEQLRPFIEKVKEEYPTQKIIVTFFSPSGYEVQKNYNLADKVLYLPFDFKDKIKPLLTQISPCAMIIVRYEFWLNTINIAHQQKIPLFLISASFRKDQVFFKYYGGLFRNALRCFNLIFVVQKSNVDDLYKIAVQNVIYAPDTRLDRVLRIANSSKTPPLIEDFLNKKDCALVCGSTWSEDLPIILPYINNYPTKKIIIAPHHIDEKTIREIEKKLTISNIRYSALSNNFDKEINVLIIDNFGMLASLYKYGKCAYVGGGFGTSVHNVLEAAVYGKPVLFGPHHKKAVECLQLKMNGIGFEVTSEVEFSKQITALIDNREGYQEISKAAQSFIQTNQGGTNIIYDKIKPFFEHKI
jgi:3-deoxy-D-manno-octulosonic-acid transferase